MGSLSEKPRTRANTVCIIGAGPSGVAAAKYLLAEKVFSRITIFEQRDTVGGIWNYVPCSASTIQTQSIPQIRHAWGHNKPRRREQGAPKRRDRSTRELEFMSPVYDRLETNIPRGLMGFSDLDWPEDCQLFPRHEAVLEYIQKYAEDVAHLIHFSTQVIDVRLDGQERWMVQSRDVAREDATTVTELFDAVIVANGHFNIPYIPEVKGIDTWNAAYPGSILHSKFYRSPENYTGKKVVVVGNSASGIDIGAQIATTCKLPLLVSQRSESFLQPDPSPTKVEKPEIIEYMAENRSIRFADGSVESHVDTIVYCTGYFYSFPFLSSIQPPLLTDGERVHNLYQHIFFRDHPTLAFLVLNQKVIPFPLAEAQSAVIARVFAGRLDLPDASEMAAWEAGQQSETGGGRKFHVLQFPKDADYINMMHDWASSAREEGKEAASTRERGAAGKTPPYWAEKEYWTRERFPAIKKAFQNCGEERHTKRTLEDVGFDFKAWNRDRRA